MTRYSRLLLIAVPLFASCSGGEVTSPVSTPLSSSMVSASAFVQAARPAGGTCKSAFRALPPLPGDPANYLRLHIEYACRLEHLGRSTAIAEQLVVITSPTTATASNATTYRAANGDLLYATWTGTATMNGPDIQFSGQEVFQGGTGRFVTATGSTWGGGTASFVTNKGAFTGKGTISF